MPGAQLGAMLLPQSPFDEATRFWRELIPVPLRKRRKQMYPPLICRRIQRDVVNRPQRIGIDANFEVFLLVVGRPIRICEMDLAHAHSEVRVIPINPTPRLVLPLDQGHIDGVAPVTGDDVMAKQGFRLLPRHFTRPQRRPQK